MNEHWCPWDDPLEDEFIYHLAILDVSLFLPRKVHVHVTKCHACDAK